jgi:hypothetical protein
MSKSQLRAVDNQRMHPKDIARQAVKRWRSDAEKQGLPVANTTTGSGAPLLDVDAVLHHADHTARLGRK